MCKSGISRSWLSAACSVNAIEFDDAQKQNVISRGQVAFADLVQLKMQYIMGKLRDVNARKALYFDPTAGTQIGSAGHRAS